LFTPVHVAVLVYVLVAARSVVFVTFWVVVIALDAVVVVIVVAGVAASPGHRRHRPRLRPRHCQFRRFRGLGVCRCRAGRRPWRRWRRRGRRRLRLRRCPFRCFGEFLRRPHCAGRRCRGCWNRKVEKNKIEKKKEGGRTVLFVFSFHSKTNVRASQRGARGERGESEGRRGEARGREGT
jgi:hypothetical protein